MRINRLVLTNSMFNPKPIDFAWFGFLAVIGGLLVLTAGIEIFADPTSARTFSFAMILLAAIAVFIFLELWLIAAYERLMLPLRTVEVERALVAGRYAHAQVAAQPAWRRFFRRYWSRTAIGPDGQIMNGITGHRESGAFEAYVIAIPRRPFLFRQWLFVPLTVLEKP